MDTIQANINNLISLWENASRPFQTYFETESFDYCYIPDSQWPNRIWVKQNTMEKALTEIISINASCKEEMTFSYFDQGCEEDVQLILQNGFKEKSCQYGMSLKLHQQYLLPSRLSFKPVNNKEDIKLWCNAFQAAFGYGINEVTVEKSFKSISYFNIFFEEQVVGTLILHKSGDIEGVHSLGVVPQMRGKGFARETMHYALNLAIKHNAKIVTLQASEMAKFMYEKLGFTTQFLMRNYRLKQ